MKKYEVLSKFDKPLIIKADRWTLKNAAKTIEFYREEGSHSQRIAMFDALSVYGIIQK